MDAKGNGVDLVVVGSIGLDTVVTQRESRSEVLGGSVSYACAAASFFARTGMVGVVGSDFPEAYVERYASMGIDLAGLQREAGETFRWSGKYEMDMNVRRTLSTELNVFEHFTPTLPESYRDSPFVLLGNISPALQLHVLSQTRDTRFVAADTMDLWIATAGKELRELIGRVDLLTVNDEEARQLTGMGSVLSAARAILGWGPRFVVVKKGEHGALLVWERGLALIPAYPLEQVYDPTGAGDAFAGAFMGALAEAFRFETGTVEGAAVRRALFAGAVVASFVVEDFSFDGLARVNRLAIDERLELLGQMAAFDAGGAI